MRLLPALGILAVMSRIALSAADCERAIELGPPQTLLTDQALGLRYFPDGRIAFVRTEPDCRLLLASGVSSYLIEGSSPSHLTKATRVLAPGLAGEFDNGYAGINSTFRAKSGELLAIYHAEDQEGMRTVGNGIPGFYCQIGLATSKDDGNTFRKLGAVLSGQRPKDPNGPGDQGVGEPWVVVDQRGAFLYAYYTSHERIGSRGVQICMARCPLDDATKAGAWKKFHEGSFQEPGLGGKDTAIVETGTKDADAMCAHVAFLPSLRQYVMTYCINAWREGGEARLSGFYVAFSDDGIHWPADRRKQIWRVPVIARLGKEVAWHPTFVPERGASTGGWLYFGYSENWGHQPPEKPHYLQRRTITIR